MVADLCQPVCHPAAKVGVIGVDGFPPWDVAGDDGWQLIPVPSTQQLFDLVPVARSQRLVRVAQVIEDQGSRVTSTEVGVSGVDISLRDGRGTIAGFDVASPDGFKTSHAFSLGEITVDIDLGSVSQDPVVIEEIRVRAPVVSAELLRSGSSNLDVLRKSIQEYAASHGGDRARSDADLKRVRIKRKLPL